MNEHTRKDGLTVKKLIALLALVACLCVGTVGCGDKTTPKTTPTTKPA